MLYLMVAGPHHGLWQDFDFGQWAHGSSSVAVMRRTHAGYALDWYASEFMVATYRLWRFAFVGTEAYLDVLVHDAFDVTRASVFIDALHVACDPYYESAWRYA